MALLRSMALVVSPIQTAETGSTIPRRGIAPVVAQETVVREVMEARGTALPSPATAAVRQRVASSPRVEVPVVVAEAVIISRRPYSLRMRQWL